MIDQKLYELIIIANGIGIRNTDIADVTGYSEGYVKNWATIRIPKDYDFVIAQIIGLIKNKSGETSKELERWERKWNDD